MVHEIEGVPEELYNLTQLAEVSLAAGKLPPYQPHQQQQEYSYTYQMNHKQNWNTQNGIDSCQDTDNNKVLNYSTSTKKKWKNEWEESCYQSIRTTKTNDDYNSTSVMYPAANIFNTLSPHSGMNNHALTTNSYQHHLQNYESPYGTDRRSFSNTSLSSDLTMMNSNNNNDTSRRNSLVSTSSSLASSSDDDSSLFSYSHKVFDRKKIRRNIDYGANGNNSADNTNSMTNSTESDQGSVESGAEEIHTCPECGKKYSTSSNLARHRQTHR